MLNRPAVSSFALVSRILHGAIAASCVLLLGMSSGAQTRAQQQAEPRQQAQQQTPPAQDNNRLPDATDQAAQAAPPPSGQYPTVPSSLTIPAGTVLMVRINDFLSSDQNRIGDEFTGTLEQPIVVNGWVVARRGEVVIGQVKAAQKAGRVKGVSHLGVDLTDMTLVDGKQVPILTELWKASAGTSHGQDAATIGTGTVLGAIIGAAADWGKGAGIGAGAGAAAGIGTVLLTRGRPTELEPETPLSFRLVDPVTVDTSQSQQAFLPVSQEDFESRHRDHRPRRTAYAYPGWGPWLCGYWSPCYFYPGYVGLYDGGWWGPGLYGRHTFRRAD